MPPKRGGGIYKGSLAKPIIRQAPLTFWGAVVPKRIADYQKKRARHERANAAAVERQILKKTALLFDHYGIVDKTDMRALAFALAVEHVPGFKVLDPEAKPKRGRKLKWHPDRLEELYRTVESIKMLHRFTDKQALKFLVNNQEYTAIWGVPTGQSGSEQQWIETLETRLQEAKRLQKRYEELEDQLKSIAVSAKFRNSK
jgi:hypothetical protein